MKLTEIKRLLRLLKKKVSSNGKILIFTLDTRKNEIPTFNLMKLKLNKSLKRDQKIQKMIKKLYPNGIKKKFIFKVKIKKKKYIEMLKNRFISTLIPFSKKQLIQGIHEIETDYNQILKFKDKLTCIIL